MLRCGCGCIEVCVVLCRLVGVDDGVGVCVVLYCILSC